VYTYIVFGLLDLNPVSVDTQAPQRPSPDTEGGGAACCILYL